MLCERGKGLGLLVTVSGIDSGSDCAGKLAASMGNTAGCYAAE